MHSRESSDSRPTLLPDQPVPSTSARFLHRLTWHERQAAELSLGERAADVLRNAMGSWTFVGLFVLFMAVWAAANTFVVGWDRYPFILLNLFLSMLAGLQGAILLIAAKRQDGIAAALARSDFDTNVAARTDIEALLDLHRQELQLLQELRDSLGTTIALAARLSDSADS